VNPKIVQSCCDSSSEEVAIPIWSIIPSVIQTPLGETHVPNSSLSTELISPTVASTFTALIIGSMRFESLLQLSLIDCRESSTRDWSLFFFISYNSEAFRSSASVSRTNPSKSRSASLTWEFTPTTSSSPFSTLCK